MQISIAFLITTMSKCSDRISVSENHVISNDGPLNVPSESLGDFLFKHLRMHSKKVAQIDVKTGKTNTFSELLEKSTRTALKMRDLGISRKDVVCMCSNNHLDTPIPIIATQFLGAISTQLDIRQSKAEFRHFLALLKPTMVFLQKQALESVEECCQEVGLTPIFVIFEENFSDFVKPHLEEDVFEPVKIENVKDTAGVFLSSGTTGLPKGICLSHYSILGQLINGNDWLKSNSNQSSFYVLYYSTFYWQSTLIVFLQSVRCGSSRLVCQEFDVEEFSKLLRVYKPKFIILTPIQVIQVIEEAYIPGGTIGLVVVAGASLSTKLLLKLIATFPNCSVCQPYGQTECSGVITSPNILKSQNSSPSKLISVGTPIAGCQYKIVDLRTNKNVGFHQEGELHIRTNFVMNGYYKTNSAEAWDEDGWLKTGDIMYFDENFNLYFVERIKEAFRLRGWVIIPKILEDILYQHPAVRTAVVIGIPKDDGDHPMVVITLKDGITASETEIKRLLTDRVPKEQTLTAEVKFVNDIPLTPTGKIKRLELKRMIQDRVI